MQKKIFFNTINFHGTDAANVMCTAVGCFVVPIGPVPR